jgi:hypothetical protein
MHHYLEINLCLFRNKKCLNYKKKIPNFIISAWGALVATAERVTGEKTP